MAEDKGYRMNDLHGLHGYIRYRLGDGKLFQESKQPYLIKKEYWNESWKLLFKFFSPDFFVKINHKNPKFVVAEKWKKQLIDFC